MFIVADLASLKLHYRSIDFNFDRHKGLCPYKDVRIYAYRN